MKTEKACQGEDTLIFACSGAADVGAIADQTARKLTQLGAGQMFCLSGVGGRVDPIMEKTRSSSRVLAIDGCDLDCVKKTLAQAGISHIQHLRITDLGLKKGNSPANDKNVGIAITQATALLRTSK